MPTEAVGKSFAYPLQFTGEDMGWFTKGQNDVAQGKPQANTSNVTTGEREQYQKGVASQKAHEQRQQQARDANKK